MNKNEQVQVAIALCKLAIKTLEDVKADTDKELSLIFKACGIEDQDAEKIEDSKLYGITLNLESNSRFLTYAKGDLNSVIKDLEKLGEF